MNNDDQYQDSDSYEQADYGASEGDHYDAAVDEEVQQNRRGGGGLGDLAPRESRKERRRRLAMEQQNSPDDGSYDEPSPHAEAGSGYSDSHAAYSAEPEPQDEHPVEPAGPKTPRFGFLKNLIGRSKMDAEATESDPVEESVHEAAPEPIALPMNAVIDPAMLAEYGLDANALVSMGVDPSTLPQFDEEFLTELGINPQIVIDILRRQAAAESVPGKRKFDTSKASWGRRLGVAKRWAPAAAALTGLTATGAIWFMAGGEEVKAIPEVKTQQLAGAEAEARTKEAIAKADAGEPAAEENQAEPVTPEALPVAAAAAPTESLPGLPGSDAPPLGLSEPAAAAPPIALASADPVGLPPMPPETENLKDPKDLPPMADLPALPSVGDAPPLPGSSAENALPVADAKPPGMDLNAQPEASKSTDKANILPPISAGIGAAALAADSLASPKLPETPPIGEKPKVAIEAPPGDLPPLGNVSEPPKTTLAEPPGLPPLGAETPSVKSESKPLQDVTPKVDGSKATAAVAGLAAGLGIDKIVKKADANPASKPVEVKPEDALPSLGAQPPVDLPKKPEAAVGSAALVAEKSADLPTPGAGREPASAVNKNAIPDSMKTEAAQAQAGGSASHAGLPEAKADWPTIPNGRGRVLRSIAGSSASGGSQALAAAAGVGGGMAIASMGNRNDRATAASFDPSQGSSGSEIAPIKHLVQSGENFWTISRDYYGSGRYYKALWSANRNQVAKIDQLHVGDTIRIPAMEYLDKSLIESSGVAKSKRQGAGNGDQNPSEVARSLDSRAVRTGNDIESKPTEQEPAASKPKTSKMPAVEEPVNDKEIVSQPLGETASKSNAPRHRVQPGETLRTIARDRLGDARRGDEIVALNADILESTRSPIIPGQILKLPAGSKDD